MAPQENMARRETEACQGTRGAEGLREMREQAALLVPPAHWDHLDCQVQLAGKGRREKWVSLVPEEIQAELASQDPQDHPVQ